MRLEVLRSAALCWFGNEHLYSPDESHLSEVSLKSCFRGVERLEFVRPNAHQFAAPGAGFVLGTKTWFRRLKADHTETLRLHLPLSLLEPRPELCGLVSDSAAGCDIWTPVQSKSSRNVEYIAHRFPAWSLPRLEPATEVCSQLSAAITSLHAELGNEGTPLARRFSKLASLFHEPGTQAEGFEDCIPNEFSTTWKHMAAQAIRAVALLAGDDLGLERHPSEQEAVDMAWKLSLRLLEAISAEVAAEREQAAAA
jgi:hypothetical protein